MSPIVCLGCGGTFLRSRREVSKHCGQFCRYQSRVKYGTKTTVNGYIAVKAHGNPGADANGYVYEHRLVAEQVLGRYLAAGECVHHINHDKRDNRPENLEVCESNSAHIRHHAAECAERGEPTPLNRPEAIAKRWITAAQGRWVIAEISAYCPCSICCGTHDKITANNTSTDAVPYAFAPDRSLPFGTCIYVPAGLGVLDSVRADDRWLTVDDRGGALDTEARKNGTLRLDLRVRDHWWAKAFGRRFIAVFISDKKMSGAAIIPPAFCLRIN